MITESNQVLCLLGSPRRGGNSDFLTSHFCEQALTLGASIEKIALSDLQYNGCINLFRCKKDLDHCGQQDGLVPILDKISKTEVLVLASPVYFTNVTGQLKLVIDRLFSFLVPGYPTAENKSRLSPGRKLVFIQTQGEGENRYPDLLDIYSPGFRYLGYDHQYLIRAWGVREPGEVATRQEFLDQCSQVAEEVFD